MSEFGRASRLRASRSSRDASQITATQASSMSTVAAAFAKSSATTYVLSIAPLHAAELKERLNLPPSRLCGQVRPAGDLRQGDRLAPKRGLVNLVVGVECL